MRVSAHTLYFQKLESLAYIFVAACMGLSSLKCVQLAPKDASFLHQSAFWSFKVVQGHPRSMILVPVESAYRTSYWSVIVTIWSFLAPFLRYGDLLAKNCPFFLPLSHSAPSLPMFPLEFCGEVKRESWGYPSEDPMIVAGVVLTQCQRVTDRQTDRWTDLL